MYIIIAAQSAQVDWPIWTALVGQPRQSEQQYGRSAAVQSAVLQAFMDRFNEFAASFESGQLT